MKYSFLLLLFVLAACSSSPYSDQYTTDEPLARDVVGYYEYDFQNVDAARHDSIPKDNKPFIMMNPDKTFTFHRMPSFVKSNDGNFHYNKKLTHSGKWQIIVYQNLKGDEKHWGVQLDPAPDDLTNIGFLGPKAPRGMIVFYGDHADGKVMLLRKR